MLAGPLNFQQLTKFHWDHKWIVVKVVSFFVCGVQGLGCFPSLLPSVPGAIQSGGRQCVTRPPMVQPQLCLVAVCSDSRGRGGCLQEPWAYAVVHLIFPESHTLLFWDHFPKPWILHCEQRRYAEITLSEQMWKMRKGSGWQCERGIAKSEVATDIQSEDFTSMLGCTSAICSRKSFQFRWKSNLLASAFADLKVALKQHYARGWLCCWGDFSRNLLEDGECSAFISVRHSSWCVDETEDLHGWSL